MCDSSITCYHQWRGCQTDTKQRNNGGKRFYESNRLVTDVKEHFSQRKRIQFLLSTSWYKIKHILVEKETSKKTRKLK